MTGITLSLHGLDPKDAVELVGRKIQRALRAHSSEIVLLLPEESAKLRRKVEAFLSMAPEVREFGPDEKKNALRVKL